MPQNTKKNILITGCSSGIGFCLATGLVKRGYRVIASCRHQQDTTRLRQQGLEAIQLDLAQSASVEQAIDYIGDNCSGRIYGLINNGAYGQPGAVIDLNRDVLREQFETNVFGTQHLTNGILPMMLPHREGRVIQISSILGFICLRFRGAYNASKFALEGLTDTMRLEHSGSGVQFSLVQPGPISSRFRQNAYQMFKQNIDRRNSMFNGAYERVEQRLAQMENARFTLPPEAVLKAVTHALESRQARVRYRVTTPTKIMAALKRLLPDRMMDTFLATNSDQHK
ncbi:MAG: SDR family NAD(P)-dependent oxidoreductase [bacterium]